VFSGPTILHNLLLAMQKSVAMPLLPYRSTLGAAVLAALLQFGLSGPVSAQEPTAAQGPLPQVQLSAGIHVIHAEVAKTEESRRTGLMFRDKLENNDGMLFVFEAPDVQCFWMHNTTLPLSIAFIADDGTVVNVDNMAPETDTTHCSKKPVRYALEMAQGWYHDHGISAGKKIDGLP
jgi:uncharacterized membrane protein (UPF0127 family)